MWACFVTPMKIQLLQRETYNLKNDQSKQLRLLWNGNDLPVFPVHYTCFFKGLMIIFIVG